MKNSRWEKELHHYNQYEEERLKNLEDVLMQFMETSQANFKANQHAIHKIWRFKLVSEQNKWLNYPF